MKRKIVYPVQNSLTVDLQFFGAENEGRTEKATSKKREDARKEGQVAKSTELNTAILLMLFFGTLGILGTYYMSGIKGHIIEVFEKIPYILGQSTHQQLLKTVGEGLGKIIILNGPLWGILFIGALLVSLIQVGYKPTFKPMAPKMSKMNPLKGLKKIISKDMLMELVKSMGKVIFLGVICLSVIKEAVPLFLKFPRLTTMQIMANIGSTISKVGLSVGGAFLFLAVIDYAYQRYKFEESIKMTKQEIKDEYKQSEGDPQIKGKIRQKMREMSMKRMMQAIPEADVIITNPTHFAIAIAYNEKKNRAPMVVAKGVDYMALKIKEKAKVHRIEIVENKPLARALYYTVDIDQEIPPELYNAVAEVLAFVYSLKK